MKKRLSRRLVMFGTALMLSALTAFPALAVTHAGHLDAVSATSISGWAWDSESPDSAVSVELTISGESNGPAGNTVFTVSADQSREDLKAALGSAAHGFMYTIDWSKFATGNYTVTAAAVSGEIKTPLIGTITYKKEDGPASGPTSAAATTPSTGSVSGPASASGLTPEQIALGPGYVLGPASSTATQPPKPYGPGAASYETGEADQYLGSFHATAYCGCEKCSGGHTHTYSGTIPQPNHTIAADLEQYPIGTKLMINDIVYTVEDKGNNVVDNRIDIFFATHEEALAFGLQTVDVYSVK